MGGAKACIRFGSKADLAYRETRSPHLITNNLAQFAGLCWLRQYLRDQLEAGGDRRVSLEAPYDGGRDAERTGVLGV
jgi:hypothetical protein